MISGEASFISQFYKQSVMFHDETSLLPNDFQILGCFLVFSIYVDPAMTAKIFTQNGQVLHRSSYRPLTSDEIEDKDG